MTRRPKIGGRRAGSGRKPVTGVTRDVVRKFYLTPDEAARLDAARGEQPISDYTREAIDQRIVRDSE